MFDPAKLKLYYDHCLNVMTDEGPSDTTESVVNAVIEQFIDPLKLSKSAKILDIGSGVGYFIDAMKKRGYPKVSGTTWTTGDSQALKDKDHDFILGDINFIKCKDAEYDFIFCRHALEKSVFPMVALLEYNRILKKGGQIYVEMPAPMNARRFENMATNYSVMNEIMLQSLIQRAGFEIEWYRNAQIPLTSKETGKVTQEVYNCVLAKKIGNIEVK